MSRTQIKQSEGNNESKRNRSSICTIRVPEEDHHPQSVVHCNQAILRNQEFCDVVFIVGPEKKEVKCHKIFLIARSPVFKIKFSDRWDNGSEGIAEIHLPDENAKAFEAFIEYIYTDKFSETLVDAVELMAYANYYDVAPLAEKCVQVMTKGYKSVYNVIEIYETALYYSLIPLIQKIERYIQMDMSKLANNPMMETLDELMLIRILSWNGLQLEEFELFNMIRRWAKSKRQCDPQLEFVEEKEVLKNLLPLIRFPVMRPGEFTDHVIPTNLLSDTEVIEVLAYFSTGRISVGQKLPFKNERRFLEQTLYLYPTSETSSTNPTRTNRPFYKYADSKHVQIDMLSFDFKCENYFPNRKVILTGLTLQGPSIPFYTGSRTSSGPDSKGRLEKLVTISIGEKRPDGSVKLLSIYYVTIHSSVPNVLNISESPNLVQLLDNRQYQISVTFDKCFPVVGRSNQKVDPSIDPVMNRTIQASVVSYQNEIGKFQLTNIKSTAFLYNYVTRKCKSPLAQNTYSTHVVSDLTLQYI